MLPAIVLRIIHNHPKDHTFIYRSPKVLYYIYTHIYKHTLPLSLIPTGPSFLPTDGDLNSSVILNSLFHFKERKFNDRQQRN